MTVLPYPRQFLVMARFTIIKTCKGMFTLKDILQITVQLSVEWYFCFSCYVFEPSNSSAITREIVLNVLQLCGQNKWDRLFRFFLFCELSVNVCHFNIVDRGSLFFFTRKSKGLFDWKSGIKVHCKWKKTVGIICSGIHCIVMFQNLLEIKYSNVRIV